MRSYCVLTNNSGTLYVGVTNNMARAFWSTARVSRAPSPVDIKSAV
jgi:hypothetical protein